MKHLILVLFLLLQFAFAKAQTYVPFPDSNAIWREVGWQTPCCPLTNITMEFQNFMGTDTVIANTTYKKILKTGNYISCDQSCCYPGCANYIYFTYSNSCCNAIRDDTINKKIFLVPSGDSLEYLLYDFNLSLGDTLPQTYTNDTNQQNYVVYIDSILIDGKYHKRYAIANGLSTDTIPFVFLIEGIGSTFGLFGNLIPPFEAGSQLYCFYQNDQIVYIDPLYGDSSLCNLIIIPGIENSNEQKGVISVYPNPAKQKLYFKNDLQKEANVRIFNYQGKLIKSLSITGKSIDISGLPSGLYLCRLKSGNGHAVAKFSVVK